METEKQGESKMIQCLDMALMTHKSGEVGRNEANLVPCDGSDETQKSMEVSRNKEESVSWDGPVPVFLKQNKEDAVHWRFAFCPVCTSQLSSTLSLTLPFHTFQVIKEADYIFIHQCVVLSCIQQPKVNF